MIVIRMLRAPVQRGLRSSVGGFAFASVVMTVWQLRHSNLSKYARFSCDLLACMAMPQIGQCRIGGRWRELMKKHR